MTANVKKIFQDALTYYQAGRVADAEAACNRVLALDSRHFDALHLLGVMAYQAQHMSRAAEVLTRALTINQASANAHHTYGSALWALGRPESALTHLDRAIALKPDFAPAHNMRGNALRDLHRHSDALQSFETAVSLDPNLADAHWHVAICSLQMGFFSKGWDEYEWRWRLKGKAARSFPKPQWQGEDLQGKTILLHDEQGLGDTIQFSRYATVVAALGAKVILGVQKPLVPLLSGLTGVSHIAGWGDAVPAFDFHAPLLSLPRTFKTDAATIPVTPRYLAGSAQKLAEWGAVLGPKTKPRIGLVWSGSNSQIAPYNPGMPLAALTKVLSPAFEFISLQKDVQASDRAVLEARADIQHFGERLKDFSDTAALCDLMDLVISIDTSVAHLAGALGRPLWLLLPFNPDWRWLLAREDSPWYPSARLFRQRARGDWDGVLARVHDALRQNETGGSFLPPAAS